MPPQGLRPYRCRILCGGRGSSAGRFDEETVVRMRRALERLRPDERVLVALFYEEERSLAEIAQIMNLTLSNVKVRLHRLRGRLRHYMEE